MIPLTPLSVAQHWPFLDEQLVLGRWKNGRAALELLSNLQVEAGGEPVNLGRKRLNSACESAGEAGAVWRALVELEARKVIARTRGTGTRPDAWSFRPDIGHWRSMPWKESGRGVQRALQGCRICRAVRAVGAIDPGPRLALVRGGEEFRLDWRHHLGLYPPESRGKGAERAARAQSPAWEPVETRGYGAENRPSRARDNSVEELKVLHWQSEEHEEVCKIVEEAVEAKTRQAYKSPTCKPRLRLVELTRFLDRDQARVAARLIASSEEFVQIPWAHRVFLPEIFSSPEVKRARRTERGDDDVWEA